MAFQVEWGVILEWKILMLQGLWFQIVVPTGEASKQVEVFTIQGLKGFGERLTYLSLATTQLYLGTWSIMGSCYQWTGFIYPPLCFPASNSHVIGILYSAVELSSDPDSWSQLSPCTVESWYGIPQCQWWLSDRSSELWCWLWSPLWRQLRWRNCCSAKPI